MSRVKTKFIEDSAVTTNKVAADSITGTKIRLDNNQNLRARNNANTADINIAAVDATDTVLLGSSSNNTKMRSTNFLPNASTGNLGSGTNLWNLYCNNVRTSLVWNSNNATIKTEDSTVSNSFFIYSGDASSGASGDITVKSGNAIGGNSGSVIIQTGSSSGGTRGDIQLKDSSLSGSSTGYVWTLQNTTTGKGSWATLPAASPFDVATVSTNTNAVANKTYLVNSSGGAVSITLPSPILNNFVTIKDKNGTANTNNITILPNTSEQVENGSSYIISSNGQSVTAVSDGTNWYIV